MGMEFRDSNYVINAKCGRTLKSNMIFNLSLGFTDLEESAGRKYVPLLPLRLPSVLTDCRYAMLLTDTVKVDHEKGICLSDCIKSSKDVLFFLNSQSDEDDKEKSKPKKAPAKTNGHVSPTKHKVVGG